MAERSLVGYLIVPRPVEAVATGIVAPTAYALAQLADLPGDVGLGTMLLAWAVFELGVYQARYMLNDLADAEVDQAHAAAEQRGRLPAGRRAARWAAAVIVARLVVSAAVIAVLPGRAGPATAVAALGVGVLMVVYEALRSPMRRRPIDPARVTLAPRYIALMGSLLTVACAGHGLRFAFGVALAGGDGAGTLGLAALFGCTAGLASGVMVYLLDAASLRAEGDTATLSRKWHVAVVSRMIDEDPDCLDGPVLTGRLGRLVAWLMAGASAMAIALGVEWGGSPGPARLALLAAVCVVGAPVLLARWPSPAAGLVVMAVDAGAALALATGAGRDDMAALLLLVSMLAALHPPGTLATIRAVTAASTAPPDQEPPDQQPDEQPVDRRSPDRRPDRRRSDQEPADRPRSDRQPA